MPWLVNCCLMKNRHSQTKWPTLGIDFLDLRSCLSSKTASGWRQSFPGCISKKRPKSVEYVQRNCDRSGLLNTLPRTHWTMVWFTRMSDQSCGMMLGTVSILLLTWGRLGRIELSAYQIGSLQTFVIVFKQAFWLQASQLLQGLSTFCMQPDCAFQFCISFHVRFGL